MTGTVSGLAEMTLEIHVRGPIEHPGGDRSIYFEDPVGNMVEAWDFLHRQDSNGDGVKELR
jgi:hypothetical protein